MSRQLFRNSGLTIFSPLTKVDFSLLLFGQSISKLGDIVYEIALGWTVYSFTGSAQSMGIVLAFFWIPQILFVLFTGYMGDFLSRKTILVGANYFSALSCSLLVFCFIYKYYDWRIFAAVSFMLGIASSISSPVYYPLIKESIKDDVLLQKANALDSMSLNFVNILGPAIGGLIFSAFGTIGSFLFNLISFIAGAVSTSLIRNKDTLEKENIHSNYTLTIKYLLMNRWILWVIFLSASINSLVIAPFFTILPGIVREAHAPIYVISFSFALNGICGIIAGSFIAKWKNPSHRAGWYSVGMLCCGFSPIILSYTSVYYIFAIIAAAILGLFLSVGIFEHTLIQLSVPNKLLNRIYSLDLLGSYLAMPIGFITAGFFADKYSKSHVLFVDGCLMMSIAFIIVLQRSLWKVDTVHE